MSSTRASLSEHTTSDLKAALSGGAFESFERSPRKLFFSNAQSLIVPVAFIASLSACYRLAIVPYYQYQYMTWGSPGLDIQVYAGLISLASFRRITAVGNRQPSDIALWFLWTFLAAPFGVVGVARMQQTGLVNFFLAHFAINIALVLAHILSHRNLNFGITLGSRTESQRTTIQALGLAAFFAILLTLATFGLPRSLSSPLNVFDTRLQSRETLTGGLPGTAYIFKWLGTVIAPSFAVYGLVFNRYRWIGVGLAIQVMIFSLSATRSSLTSIPLILAVAFWMRRKGLLSLVTSMTILTTIATLLSWLFSWQILSGALVRRALFVPANVQSLYLEYYSTRPKMYLSHSIVGRIFGRSERPSVVLGEHYFGSSDSNLNGNLFADGFANFGLSGILIAGISLGLYLQIYNRIAVRRDFRATALLLVIPASLLVNAALLTSLLTGGLLLLLFVVALWPTSGSASDDATSSERTQTLGS